METVVPPPPDDELHLLTEWGDPSDRARGGWSALLSLLAHAAAIVFVLLVPELFMQPLYREQRMPAITPLIDPPSMLTQKEPNVSKTIREMRSPDLSPRLPMPPGPSTEPQAPAPRKKVASPPPPPPPPPKPVTPLPDPPKIDIAANEPPKLTLPVQVQPPQAPQPKKPAFEDVQPIAQVPPDQRVLPLPGPTVASAIRGELQGQGSNTLGNAPVPSSGADLPQLLSDPQGIDFAPYLAHVLASVRGYWNTIIPGLASVKAGHKGLVSLEFAIQRDGTVSKIVFAQSTNDQSLNNAAVQAVSGGGPFGALPRQYQGLEIHVQMNFAYNVPRR